MALFSFKPKTDEVLNHWIAFAESFSFAPQEFYQLIEKELSDRKIPGLEISRIEYNEGGLLSDQRVYLRMIRERLAFDTCATPFGSGFLFSCRTIYSPVMLRLWHVLAVLFFFNLTFGLLFQFLGFQFATIAEVTLLLTVIQVFRNAGAARQFDLDAALLKIPAFGPIYECWFRADTYFRQDTRLAYLETVPKLIKDLADEVTGAKGIKLVRQYESAPILGELYKPVNRSPPQQPTS